MNKKKKIQGAAMKPARGKLSLLRSVQNQHPLDAVNRRKTDVQWTSFDLDRLTGLRSVLPSKTENKKYNIRRIILCQKMEKDVQEIHIHSHR